MSRMLFLLLYVLIFVAKKLRVTTVFAFTTNCVKNNNKHSPFRSKSSMRASGDSIPTWEDLASKLDPESTAPIAVDGRSFSSRPPPSSSSSLLTLYRERHGWCPYSERVWLALEAMDVEYETVFIDNIYGRPSWYSGDTPQIQWHDDGSVQSESMDLVREISKRTSDDDSKLYPKDIESEVINKVRAFNQIFPSRTRPSSRAAFLFRFDGEPLWKNEFEKVLKDTDQLLSETSNSGPFFCGRFTAADIAWMPFLERYGAQLPCLHEGLNPRCEQTYPNLAAWYDAVETLDFYSCRVQGDASSWRKVLTMAGFGNAGNVPSLVSDRMEQLDREERAPLTDEAKQIEYELWDNYRAKRPWMACTPSSEAAATLIRNREAIIKDISSRNGSSATDKLPSSQAELDEAMRTLANLLINENMTTEAQKSDIANIKEAQALAAFLDERMCVPRDMGRISAACIKRLAYGN